MGHRLLRAGIIRRAAHNRHRFGATADILAGSRTPSYERDHTEFMLDPLARYRQLAENHLQGWTTLPTILIPLRALPLDQPQVLLAT